MIAMIYALHAGNALRLMFMPPDGAAGMRLLRKGDDTFASEQDPAALVLHDGDVIRDFTDFEFVPNGLRLHYAVFYRVGQAWVPGGVKSAVAGVAFSDDTVDYLELVRSRLELGLRNYVAQGKLRHKQDSIPVLLSSPLVDKAPLPLVTVKIASESAAQRFLGDVIDEQFQAGADGFVHSSVGYLSRVQLQIVAWSLNADERAVFRRAIKSLLTINQTIFESAGLNQIEPSFSDSEDFQTWSVPMYQAVCTLSFVVMSSLDLKDQPVRDVSVSVQCFP